MFTDSAFEFVPLWNRTAPHLKRKRRWKSLDCRGLNLFSTDTTGRELRCGFESVHYERPIDIEPCLSEGRSAEHLWKLPAQWKLSWYCNSCCSYKVQDLIIFFAIGGTRPSSSFMQRKSRLCIIVYWNKINMIIPFSWRQCNQMRCMFLRIQFKDYFDVFFIKRDLYLSSFSRTSDVAEEREWTEATYVNMINWVPRSHV